MKRGFTLVELSIVLVIIGLLIGGILVAQSMISTVKAQRVIRDLQQYEIAAQNFRQNYRFYPGDSRYFIPSGNNNDTLDATAGCSASSPALSANETTQFWGHLSMAKMLDVNYANYSPTSCPGGTHNATYENVSGAGVLWPYTENNALFAATNGGAKAPIIVSKNLSEPLGFALKLEPMQFLSIGQKLGARDLGVGSPPGAYSAFAGNTCLLGAPTYGLGSCTASNAINGILIYVIPLI